MMLAVFTNLFCIGKTDTILNKSVVFLLGVEKHEERFKSSSDF